MIGICDGCNTTAPLPTRSAIGIMLCADCSLPPCVVCGKNPGASPDDSGQWWCVECTETAARFARCGSCTLEVAREALLSVIRAMTDDPAEEARVIAKLDKAIADGTAGYTAPPESDLGRCKRPATYDEKISAPLSEAEIQALNKALASGNIPRYGKKEARDE